MSLKGAILKAVTSIKHGDEMADDLKFIDFHQLQIENKMHVKDIDDCNKKLLALKVSSRNNLLSLNDLQIAYKRA